MPTKEWREKNRERSRQYWRDWYARNKEKEIQRVKQRRRNNGAWLDELKGTLSCKRCGESHIACLDFHHKDSSLKEGSITKLVREQGWGRERVLVEIKKCEVLCSNCHRKKHWRERQKQKITAG